jgi:hypothetical protein
MLTLVADAGVERLDIAVAPRLAGRDEVQPDLPGCPVCHCTTSQFRSIVTPQHGGIDTTRGGETVEFADQMLAGDAAINHPAEALAGVLIDDGHDLDRPPVGGDVELEIHRPHPVGPIRGHRVRHRRATVAFTASPLRHPQPFLTPKPLNLLMIDQPALTAGIVIGRSEPATRMIPGAARPAGRHRDRRESSRRVRGVGWRGAARSPGKRTAR